MGAAQLINEIIAPVLSSLLMAQGYLYVPMFIALPMELAGFGILFVIPNTLARKSHSASGQVPEQTDNSTPADSVDEIPKKDSSGLTRRMSILSKPAKRLALLVVSDVRIGLVLLAFMVNKLSRQITELLVQYSSKRLGWTLAKVRNNASTVLRGFLETFTDVPHVGHLPVVDSSCCNRCHLPCSSPCCHFPPPSLGTAQCLGNRYLDCESKRLPFNRWGFNDGNL